MPQSRKVRISNSTLNCYGTRVLTEGVDISQYERNPILLWMHQRPWRGTKDEVLPIGTVSHIRKEGDDIIGELVFDDTDEFAQKIAEKWDAGVLKMVSPNFDIIATDDSVELLLPGQTRPTITKAKLIEVSVVDIGGNDDNIVLSRGGKQLKLGEGIEFPDLPLLHAPDIEDNQPTKQENMSYKNIALKLGLPEAATEQEVLAKVDALTKTQSANEALTQERDALLLSAITEVVESAVKERKITAEKKAHFIELGKQVGLDSLRSTLEAIPSTVLPSETLHQTGMQLSGAHAEWKKLSDVPADKLMELRTHDKPTYLRLYKAEYGEECPALS